MLDDNGLRELTAADRNEIWRTWFTLDAWPDFPPALKRLRAAREVSVRVVHTAHHRVTDIELIVEHIRHGFRASPTSNDLQ